MEPKSLGFHHWVQPPLAVATVVVVVVVAAFVVIVMVTCFVCCTSEHLTCADAVGSCVGKRDTMVSCWGLKLLISWLLETRNSDNRALLPGLPFFFFGDTAAQLFRKLQATSSLSF